MVNEQNDIEAEVERRAEADAFKPTRAQLRAEGMSRNAVDALFDGRDQLHAGRSPRFILSRLTMLNRQAPFTEADVYPDVLEGVTS